MFLITRWNSIRRKTVDTIPVLTDDIRRILSAFSKSRSLPASLVQRANIILLASQGILNQDIVVQAGLHYNHVATWHNPGDFGYEVSQWSLPLLIMEIKYVIAALTLT